MPPKSLSPALKRTLIQQFFHNTATAYSLKELESLLPSIASIHSIQVKEYIQALCDDGMIRVEKIGSSNWYWSFVSEAKKSKEKILGELREEEARLRGVVLEVEGRIEEEKALRDEGDGEDGEMLDGAGGKTGRKELLEGCSTLNTEIKILEKRLEEYSWNDPEEVAKKVNQTNWLRDSALRWTDNLESIESYLMKVTSDREKIRLMMEGLCEGEYGAGEGFKDM